MAHCDFLDKLPLELRYRIYEFHLTYQYPIKLRNNMPYSRDLPLLRLNRQIHREALQVFYDQNRIIVNASHFCKNTPSSIKSAVKAEWLRHLQIDNFALSMACTSKVYRHMGIECDFCRASPGALVQELKALPRLKTVIVKARDTESFKAAVSKSEGFQLVLLEGSPAVFAYTLHGPGLEELVVETR